ncbi:Chromate resistance protein ChrB [Nonomuraea sp. NPDC049152]|uniref:Chromate resistance protein ChrB n=1 Tax=Nonomuraea sp. NPDC049152 TaxID=3154350 RepID=UPI0033F1D60D
MTSPASASASRRRGKTQPRPEAAASGRPTVPPFWLLLTYKVPSEPSRVRVSVWRELKRLGALYLQQAVCVLPDVGKVGEDLDQIRQRIRNLDGTSYFFRVPPGDHEQDASLVASFKEMAAKEYSEIVEECRTKFVKEIEFERFRENYSFEEAEEIRQDLEKIHRWFARVVERDWFGGPGRTDCEQWLSTCESLLEEFEADVYERTSGTGRAGEAP